MFRSERLKRAESERDELRAQLEKAREEIAQQEERIEFYVALCEFYER